MITYKLNHVDGLYFELTEDEGKNREYDVTFLDNTSNSIVYEAKIKPGNWARLGRKYLSDISIFVKYQGRTVTQINLLDELEGKRVFITFESKALGDTIAWIPYCLEFAKHYKCKVIVSTFRNSFFESVYPELEFVDRGVTVHNIIGMFKIGWFWDKNMEPVNPVTLPLQKSACEILNLPFTEIQPRIAFTPQKPMIGKYICISTKSTSQCKHWYYWPELISKLKSWGYRVFEMSQDANDYGAETLDDKSLENVMNYLYHAREFIGLSSGISWLNWAIGKHTTMISNFTKSDHEFVTNCTRIVNPDVCNGCWNNPVFKFNKGDWNWCPEHEDTPRHFECHKSISVDMVIVSLLFSSVHES